MVARRLARLDLRPRSPAPARAGAARVPSHGADSDRWRCAPMPDGAVRLRAGRAPRDPLERFVAAYLAERGAAPRPDLVAAVRGWIAARERSTGGGAADLIAWGDALWHTQAERTVAHLEHDFVEPADAVCG